MRHDLAAQVNYSINTNWFNKFQCHAQSLSESVSQALTLYGGDEAKETAKFTLMFDKFFDCLNVSNYTDGKHHRKPFQSPYRSSDDFRIKVHANKTESFVHHNVYTFLLIVAQGHFFSVPGWMGSTIYRKNRL